jgi:hypothetical protein
LTLREQQHFNNKNNKALRFVALLLLYLAGYEWLAQHHIPEQ